MSLDFDAVQQAVKDVVAEIDYDIWKALEGLGEDDPEELPNSWEDLTLTFMATYDNETL